MAEVSSDLMLEILKALQRHSIDLKSNTSEIKAEFVQFIEGFLASCRRRALKHDVA